VVVINLQRANRPLIELRFRLAADRAHSALQGQQPIIFLGWNTVARSTQTRGALCGVAAGAIILITACLAVGLATIFPGLIPAKGVEGLRSFAAATQLVATGDRCYDGHCRNLLSRLRPMPRLLPAARGNSFPLSIPKTRFYSITIT
jgi:hypothetical protein